jgi:hypothetical protein
MKGDRLQRNISGHWLDLGVPNINVLVRKGEQRYKLLCELYHEADSSVYTI